MTDIATTAPTSRWVALEERDYAWNILSGGTLMGAGNGGTVTDAMTAEQVLDQTGLNVHVKKYPVSIDITRGHDGSKMLRLEKMFVTGYEAADGDIQTFGPVSDVYEVVQPVESLSMFDEIVRKVGGSHYTAGWNMPEKARMGVTIAMPDHRIIIDPGGAADTIEPFLLGVNSFDGSTSLMGIPILQRIFCTNQLPGIMSSARKKGFCFKHTRNVKTHAADAKRLLENYTNYVKVIEADANRLYQKKMTTAQFSKWLDGLTPFKITDDMGDLRKERVGEFKAEAIAAWEAPHNENVTGTRWGALNIVTEFAQWGRRVQGSSRTGTDPRRQRAIGTLVHPDPESWGREAWASLVAA